jgi:hypothetical protein
MLKTPTFFRQGDNFMLGVDEPNQRYETLPSATYLLRFDPKMGFYLELTDSFELPTKMYGNLDQRADKILNTFRSRKGTTGVSLTGEKGSGKTLLTKLISTKAHQLGIPTIIVNMGAAGDSFNLFLSSIKQPVVLLFDEFEKVYDEDAQQQLLTLLDGVFFSQKLFLLTSNTASKIDGNLQNRPGRIYYYMEFRGLETEFILEYGKDNLNNQAYLDNLGVLSGIIRPMNFDMLKAVIEESNRYQQSPLETLDMLNVRTTGYSETYLYTINVPGKVRSLVDSDGDPIGMEGRFNPIKPFHVEFYYKSQSKSKSKKESPDWAHAAPVASKTGLKLKPIQRAASDIEYEAINFEPKELVFMNGYDGIYEYKKDDGTTLKLIRKPFEVDYVAKNVQHLL